MYGIGGERELPERTIDHLSGYEGSRPVRVGNAAFSQQQHDVWEPSSTRFTCTPSRGLPAEVVWPILKRSVEAAIENWRKPDRGIWEVRGEPKHFTSSKMMCWVACDRGARLAELHGDFDLAKRWQPPLRRSRTTSSPMASMHAAFRAALWLDRAGRIGAADPTGAIPPA